MELLTTGSVMEELRITRMTLYKWIDRKIIKVHVVERGARSFFMFEKKEVFRVKARLKKDRPKGKPLLR